MDRRKFIKGSCGICLSLSSGFLLSAVLDACSTPLGIVKTSAHNNIVTIPVADFDQGTYKIVRVSNYNYDLAVQKNADGTYLAMELVCTHAGHPLTRTGNGYYCTLHGSQFAANGKVLKGPAYKDMPHLPTHITDNNLLITLQS